MFKSTVFIFAKKDRLTNLNSLEKKLIKFKIKILIKHLFLLILAVEVNYS